MSRANELKGSDLFVGRIHQNLIEFHRTLPSTLWFRTFNSLI